jgi:hypothetical protein
MPNEEVITMRSIRLRWIVLFVLCSAFVLSFSPPLAFAGSGLQVSPTSAVLGATFQFQGTGFSAGESVALWVNYPDGRIIADGTTQADSNGTAQFSVTPDTSWGYGHFVQVAHGLQSNYEVTAGFALNRVAQAKTHHGSKGGASSVCNNGNFVAGGFAPDELAGTWTTRPDGVSVGLANATADEHGVVSFNFEPQPGWPVGDYIVVAQGYTSGFQGVNHFSWNGTTLAGGDCNSPDTVSQPHNPILKPKNIVVYKGPAVYLGTHSDSLNYFDCNWKWRPMGGTIYFLVLGFKPGETVQVGYQIMGIQDWLTPYTTTTADGNGNVSLSVNTLPMQNGHYHWWFTGSSASYCGHYDLVHY